MVSGIFPRLFSAFLEFVSYEGPEGVKWELGFACFCTGKMGFRSLGLGFESEKKPKWEWDWCFVSISVGSGHWLVGFGKNGGW